RVQVLAWSFWSPRNVQARRQGMIGGERPWLGGKSGGGNGCASIASGVDFASGAGCAVFGIWRGGGVTLPCGNGRPSKRHSSFHSQPAVLRLARSRQAMASRPSSPASKANRWLSYGQY